MHRDTPEGLTLIYGGPGTGKTTLEVAALVEYGKHGATVSLDLTGDVSRALASEMPDDQRIVRVHSATDFARLTKTSFLQPEFAGFEPGTHVVFTLPETHKQTPKSSETATVGWIAVCASPLTRLWFCAAFCDEADRIFRSAGSVDDGFAQSVLVARNERRAIILAVKRPTALAPVLRTAAMRLCVFRVMSDADARAVEELGPARVFREAPGGGPQYMERGEYLYYSPAIHTPKSTLQVYSARDHVPPWLEDARAYYQRKRKQ